LASTAVPFFCRTTRKKGSRQHRGALAQFKWRALQGTACLNAGLDLDQLRAPLLKLQCGSRVSITNSTGKHQLFWRCQGCDRDRQHYRMCTSKTLQSAQDLGCPFCPLRPRGMLAVPAHSTVWGSEGRFMQLLWSFGLDSDYCHQVVPPYWRWPVDFWNHADGFYVQVDGKHHWTGMHQYSRSEIAALDMKLNAAAVEARTPLVRVHAADLQNPSCVMAALAAAAAGAAIALTPSFASCMVEWQGKTVLYVAALQSAGPRPEPWLSQGTIEHGVCVLNPK
jgi:hypothetical protein